jgi:hypothetical protein
MDKVLDIDIFDAKYTMYPKSGEEFPDEEGRFETYGKDLDFVLSIANSDKPNRVWTAMDGDEGFYLVQGYHLVNRCYYIVTTEEGGDDIEYIIDDYEDEEFE